MSIEIFFEILIAFLSNTLLLMGMAVVYSIFPVSEKFNTSYRKVIMGIVVSFIGISIMSTTYQLDTGIVFDARTIVVLISGMFLGTIPTVISTVALILYRVFVIQGVGSLTGSLWVLFGAIFGLTWRHTRLKKVDINTITFLELYLVNFLTQVVMVLLLFTMPRSMALDVIQAVFIPILLIYPVGGFVISIFMLYQRKLYFKNLDLFKSQKQYKVIFDHSKSMLFLLDSMTGKIMDVNEVAINTYGYSLEEFQTMNPFDLNILPKEQVADAFNKATVDEDNVFLFKHRKKNGDIMDVEIHTGPIVLEGKDYVFSTIVDVTDQIKTTREFIDADEKLKAVFMSVAEGIVVTDKRGFITLANDRAIEILSSKSDITGKRLTSIFRIHSNKHNITFKDIVTDVLRDNTKYRSDSTFVLYSLDDFSKEVFIDFSVAPLNINNEDYFGLVLIFRDVTIEKERQDEIRFISQHDYLTGLHNRYYFEEQMERLNTSRQLPLSIILGDVNGLKLMNDSFSHLEGDNLLIEISNILKKAVRTEDIVARWGGDEFVILLPQTSYENSRKVYERIKDLCLKSRYSKITPSISLGIATKAEVSEDIYEVLKLAEARMYREKVNEGKSLRNKVLSTLEETLADHENETHLHSHNVTKLAEEFGQYLGLDIDSLNTLQLIARLHDIGKITISKDIFSKQEPLDIIEYKQIKLHSEAGSRIVQSIPELKHISDAVLHHHERWDGEGYPHQKTEDQIPYFSRIISIIDAYEAMTNDRVYRSAMSSEEALTEIEENKGSQFDPDLSMKFIEMIKSKTK